MLLFYILPAGIATLYSFINEIASKKRELLKKRGAWGLTFFGLD